MTTLAEEMRQLSRDKVKNSDLYKEIIGTIKEVSSNASSYEVRVFHDSINTSVLKEVLVEDGFTVETYHNDRIGITFNITW